MRKIIFSFTRKLFLFHKTSKKLQERYSCFIKETHVKESDTLLLKIISIGKDTQADAKKY